MENKSWILKFLIPLLLFAALCADSAWRLGDRRPGLERCLSNPERFDGRPVWAGVKPVSATLPDGFVLTYDGRPVKVRSAARPAIGRWVTARGTFHKPDILAADEVREEPHYLLQRGGVYGISGIILAVWLWFFLKRFRLGLRGGLFHPREGA